MNSYELPAWNKKHLVAGIDEVGRGCIAGPLVICSVILPLHYENTLITDSKALSEKKRELLFEVILEDALHIDLEVINEVTIDEENIYQATKRGMERLINRSRADYYLIDAMPLDTQKESQSIIKGDLKSISIAAASIVAKVVRDEIMVILDETYPLYGFKDHKGYPTKKHKESLLTCGITTFHRKSYNPVKELL